MTLWRYGMGAALAALLVGCGGGGDDPPPERGTIITAQLAGQATTAEINAGTQTSGLQALSGLARCDVDVRYVLYMTRDPQGAPATASTAVFVPAGSDPACTGERPVVLYAHGTTTAKSFNMADISRNTTTNAFNNAAGTEASLVVAMFAAQGFIVVAPNYLGYERSSLNFHPYLNAEAQAVDMIDGLRAAKAHLQAQSAVKPSSTLLVSGYSQGGHVAMATHRTLQRDHANEFTVTASAPMSGPYNIVGFGDLIVAPNGQVNAGATIFAPLQITSYQKSYGNIYNATTDVYQPPYATGIETLFPTDTPIADLFAQGRLPADPTFTALFGAGGLLTDGFRNGYASSEFRKALTLNTLLDWTPARPMALCGGAQDPTVFFSVNTTLTQAAFDSRGVTVPAYDLEDRATLPAGAVGDAVFAGFQAQKAAAGANVQAQYHGTLVPPFCAALARGFFQQVLAQ